MRRFGSTICGFPLMVVLACYLPHPALAAKSGPLEIQQFTVPPDLQLPEDFRAALAINLVSRIQETGHFERVYESGSSGSEGTATVRLTGEITEFKKGSRAKRYFIGPGFGKTILKAHVRFIDVASGKVLLEHDVDGKVIIGIGGGDSKGATNGLAKEVAKIAKNGL